MPTGDWVLLGSGESNKGQDFGSLYLQLVCRRTLPRLAEDTCANISNRGRVGKAPHVQVRAEGCNQEHNMEEGTVIAVWTK